MSYKDTLNLPKTEFPMKAQLPKKEPETLNIWKETNLYQRIRDFCQGRPKYILHDGPPYANGDIHIGHALNKTLKDIIVKYKTMRGFDSAYVPGWDCHGLPVEHQLFKELKINKYQIDQVDFRKKAHKYAMRYVDIQREQFKRLGIFGDWDNPYLTLNAEYEEAIVSSFAELVKKDYIYRDLKPVNWCFSCETALAEAEVEYDNHNSPSVYLKFEITSLNSELESCVAEGKKLYAIVWTTTPWTLIANVAIAAHPQFKYSILEVENEVWLVHEDLVDKIIEQSGVIEYKKIGSILGSELEGLTYLDIFKRHDRSGHKFVLADYVSAEEGTGLVHTAPGHGQEDYLTGKKYNLETVMPVDKRGKFFQDIAMEFKEQHVFKANPMIIDRLREQGNLLYSEEVGHSYPHCWRCKKPIIFRATWQWFLGIDKNGLRKDLIEVAKQKITWVPPAGKERISAMIESRPDWCLSRQRYWGVPIPTLGCKQCGNEFLDAGVIDNFVKFVKQEGTDCWFIRQVEDFISDDIQCPHCSYKGKDFTKGSDILDVWFDSGVSHQAVLKKRQDLGATIPCALYLEGSDQHRGWFQSSLIPAMAIDHKPPFEAVLTHGFVVDGKGEKMSKSRGNVISPQNIIKDFGADILRMWVASSNYNEDVRISDQIVARITEAYRKIRNTVRFILSNLNDFNPDTDKVNYENLKKVDKWILFKLDEVVSNVSSAYDNFEFYKAYKGIYNFCNEDLSMYYLDMVKGRLYISGAKSQERRASQTAIYEALGALLRIMSPIFVFTAEEIWKYMPREKENAGVNSVHLLAWPEQKTRNIEEDIPSEFDQLIRLIPTVTKALEGKRTQGDIGSSFDATIILLTNNQSRLSYLQSIEADLLEIFKVSAVEIKSSDTAEIEVVVEKAAGVKCQRCWNYSLSVGKDNKYPSICEKCAIIIGRD